MSALRARLTPSRAVVAVAAVALLLYPVVSDNLYYQNMIILSLVFAIGAVGLNVISGYGGYVSLGQGAFLALGAYTLAILSSRVDVSVWIWVPVAGVVAGLFAAVLGVAEAATVTYISPSWATAVPYVVIFVVLLVRPQGLLGARLREDVAPA